jgi:hypothetical protein
MSVAPKKQLTIVVLIILLILYVLIAIGQEVMITVVRHSNKIIFPQLLNIKQAKQYFKMIKCKYCY